MDQFPASAKTSLGRQMRVSGLRSFSVKVAAYDWRELQFSEHLCGFSGQNAFRLSLKRSAQSAPESNRRSDRGIELRPPGHCRFRLEILQFRNQREIY